jgi:hypothetical protein
MLRASPQRQPRGDQKAAEKRPWRGEEQERRRGDRDERRPTGEATDRRGTTETTEATKRQHRGNRLRTLISFYFKTTVIYRHLQYYSTGNQSHIFHTSGILVNLVNEFVYGVGSFVFLVVIS